MKITLLLALVLNMVLTITVFSGCQKTYDAQGVNSNNSEGINIPRASPVKGSVAGRILNEQGMAIAGSSVKIGNYTVLTDVNGSFNTSELSLDKYLTAVQVSSIGYYTSFRSISAHPSKNYITIILIKRTSSGSFNNNSGGTISLANGTVLTFKANSFIKKNSGVAYNGSVRSYLNYIDPVTSGRKSKVCNQLLGIDGNKLYALKSMGMFVAEFETDTGEPLQLDSSHAAEVIFPIPSSLSAGAPSEIDTWSLNERGLWTKEGSASKIGNFYKMQATHFTFWNFDLPSTPIFLDLNVKDSVGNNIPYVMVCLETTTINGYGFAADFTDSLGNVSGYVPASEILNMNIYSDPITCNASQFNQQIGPFLRDATLQVVATIPASDLLNVFGSANDCNGQPLTNGTAIISANNYTYYASIVNGSFQVVISHCIPVSQIEVIIVDNIGLQQSDPLAITVAGNSINTGILSACGVVVNSFVNYNLNGIDYIISGNNTTLINAILNTTNSPTTTAGYADGGTHYLSFGVTGYGIDTFNMGQYCGVRVDNLIDVNLTAASSVTFTEYGDVGEYIGGNFNIYFVDVNGGNHHVTGTFRLARTL